jgi:hypothetical protein
MGAAMRDTPAPGFAIREIAAAVRRISICAVALAFLLAAGSAFVQPTVTVSPPQVKGQEGNPTAQSVATDQAAAKRIEEERRLRVNRIIVEGFRDPDDRTPRPQILEQRFATSLNRDSPELIAGKVYDGCHYDGSYFSCADPLSSALRNLRHILR